MFIRIFRDYVLIIIYLSIISVTYSQSNNIYFHSNPGNVNVGDEVLISQLILSEDQIVSGILFYRIIGELSYQEIPMSYSNGSWFGIISGDRVVEPGIEYVTILNKFDGGRIALPLSNNPFLNPLNIQVTALKKSQDNVLQLSGQKVKKRNLSGQYVDADILILSPEDGSINRPDEIVISASLFNAPNVDQSDYQILLDGKDLTDLSIISGDVLSLVPENELDVGLHSIKLLFKTTFGVDVTPIEWSFNVNNAMENVSESLRYKGSISGKSSSNTASGITISENELNGKIDAELSWVKARMTLRNTSRESKYVQALNRSTLSIQITDYLNLHYGDVYPSISPFILDGKRVNGRHIHLDMPWLDFHLVNGYFTRAVQYQNRVDGAYELALNDTDYDSTDGYTFKLHRTGYTFPQQVTAARIGLSLFRVFTGGIHFLKAKDDIEAIDTTASNSSLFTMDTTLYTDYKLEQYSYNQFLDSLSLNGDTLKIRTKNWTHSTPKENLALGFDFETALDNRKMIFQFAWNMSLSNSNIWAGMATKDSLDLLLDTLEDGKILEQYPVEDIGEFIESYGDYFTINPLYMTPIIPLDPVAAEKNLFRAIINMPASAFYFRVKGSYAFNNLLMEYRQIGSEYKSFGNPYLTNNIREFTINDRLSTLGRRLMIVVGYKYKDNKLSETVINPLKTNTISLNTTLVPGPGAPTIVLNLQSIGKNNSLDTINVDNFGNFISDNREDSRALNITASVNIPGNFNIVTTTTSINVNSISYSDNLASERRKDYLFQKSETQSLSATISARFQIPLKASMSFNSTKLVTPYLDASLNRYVVESNWRAMNSSIQYSMIDNKLRLRAGLDFMTNGKDDDSLIRLYGGKFGCDYDIMTKLTLSINSTIRINDSRIYINDEIDNDNDGEIDESNENWSINSSGMYITMGYRF